VNLTKQLKITSSLLFEVSLVFVLAVVEVVLEDVVLLGVVVEE